MGTRKIDKQVTYSHELAQTKQQVGQCVVGSLLVHEQATGKHELTRLTTAWTWGKLAPSPLQYSLCVATGPTPKCHFVLRIPKIGTPTTLGPHNFVCEPLIEVRYEEKLQPSLRAFQQYVASHLHARKSGRFLTLLLAITYVLNIQMDHASPFYTYKF